MRCTVQPRWGVAKFTAFLENARITKQDKEPLTPLQSRCLTCQRALMEAVRLREDVSDQVVFMGSEAQMKECPVSFEQGATEYAKSMPLYVWDNVKRSFQTMTLNEWLDNDEHLKAALMLLGRVRSFSALVTAAVAIGISVRFEALLRETSSKLHARAIRRFLKTPAGISHALEASKVLGLSANRSSCTSSARSWPSPTAPPGTSSARP